MAAKERIERKGNVALRENGWPQKNAKNAKNAKIMLLYGMGLKNNFP